MVDKELEQILEEGHEEHSKHVQLGAILEDDDRTFIEDDADLDALWDDATTVEEFEADIISLKSEDEATLEALRKERTLGKLN